jgi:hypothetical protein
VVIGALALALLAVAPADTGGTPPEAYPLVLLVQGDAGDDGLRLRRLRVGDDARAGDLRVRVVLEHHGSDQSFGPLEGGRIAAPVRLADAFVAYAPNRAFEIDAGVQRVPFTLSRQIDEADLRLPERPAFVDAATPDFRAGVALASDLGLLQVRAALLSADPSLDRALFDSGALWAVRLGAEPIGPMGLRPWRRRPDDPWYSWWRFSAGVSALYGTLAAPRSRGVGADGQLQWRRLTVTGEYLLVAGGGRQQGAVVEPGVFVGSGRLDVALRAAWSRLGGTDTLAAGAGLTLYTLGGRLRWQAAFERRRAADGGATPDAGWALLRVTLAL